MTVHLWLPATSANLGPAFDTAALALALYLEIEARPADAFSIEAEGRSPEICGALNDNLLLATYRRIFQREAGEPAPPLALRVRNGIPLGMGCGSSAASRLGGIALASRFGGLGWDRGRMLDEAAALEHHPDNAAACVLGGFVVAGYGDPLGGRSQPVRAVSFTPPRSWRAMLALPSAPLATTVSRSVLPDEYRRESVVGNLQNTALLTAASAAGDGALLAHATRDALHQPYRAAACPLLFCLLPLAGEDGILSVTLSGAGSGVLLLIEGSASAAAARIHAAASPGMLAELLPCALASEPALL